MGGSRYPGGAVDTVNAEAFEAWRPIPDMYGLGWGNWLAFLCWLEGRSCMAIEPMSPETSIVDRDAIAVRL